MEKNYKKIEFCCGTTLAECVLKLVEHASKGEFVCTDFNGHTLYSDTVSMESASLEISGCAYFDKICKMESNRQRLIEYFCEQKDLTFFIDINGKYCICNDYWIKRFDSKEGLEEYIDKE